MVNFGNYKKIYGIPDNTQKSSKIFTSLSPTVNSANKTLSNLDWQNTQFVVPANTCPANLHRGSSDCNVFYASYCTNMYDYLQSKGLIDKEKLLQIPECACYFPNTKEQQLIQYWKIIADNIWIKHPILHLQQLILVHQQQL